MSNKKGTERIITIDDLNGYGSLIAEIVGVGLNQVILLQRRHVIIIDSILESLGTGKQSGRSFAEVAKLYFGIGTPKMTLKEMAKKFGVTPPAIRVDVHRILRRLGRYHISELKALVFE